MGFGSAVNPEKHPPGKVTLYKKKLYKIPAIDTDSGLRPEIIPDHHNIHIQ